MGVMVRRTRFVESARCPCNAAGAVSDLFRTHPLIGIEQSRQSNQHRAAETAIQGSEDDPAKASTRAERTAQRGEEGRLPCDPRSARRRGRQFRPRHARAAWQPSLPAWGGFCGYINLRPGSLLALAEQVDLSRFRMSIPYRSLAGLNQARFSHAFTTKCDRSR